MFSKLLLCLCNFNCTGSRVHHLIDVVFSVSPIVLRAVDSALVVMMVSFCVFRCVCRLVWVYRYGKKPEQRRGKAFRLCCIPVFFLFLSCCLILTFDSVYSSSVCFLFCDSFSRFFPSHFYTNPWVWR